MFRTGVEALGLELMVKDEKIASPAVTSIMIPEGIEAGKITGFFRNNGIVIAGGQGQLKGELFELVI